MHAAWRFGFGGLGVAFLSSQHPGLTLTLTLCVGRYLAQVQLQGSGLLFHLERFLPVSALITRLRLGIQLPIEGPRDHARDATASESDAQLGARACAIGTQLGVVGNVFGSA